MHMEKIFVLTSILLQITFLIFFIVFLINGRRNKKLLKLNQEKLEQIKEEIEIIKNIKRLNHKVLRRIYKWCLKICYE